MQQSDGLPTILASKSEMVEKKDSGTKTTLKFTQPNGALNRIHPSDPATGACPAGNRQWDSTNWDLNAQQPHGGQEWSQLENFVEDFSVTTNFMGPPWKAIAAAASSLQHMDHYPAANFEPAITDLSKFLASETDSSSTSALAIHSRLQLGNGASELIDLVTRIAAPNGGFKVKSHTQYKEYERAALADGRQTIKLDNQSESGGDDWTILAIINPCNPTGEYMPIEKLKEYISKQVQDRIDPDLSDPPSSEENFPLGSPSGRSAGPKEGQAKCVVLVDESMQLWRGTGWREDSLVSQPEWIKMMHDELGCSIYLIHSWTKIWSCPGIRLGSILCPTAEHCLALKKHQVPWSLNVAALAFLSAAVLDTEYLRQTWDLTQSWRAQTEQKLATMFPHWKVYGEKWLSWLWIDTTDAGEAAEAVKYCKAAGTPIRAGAMGYERPTFIRLAVRSPESQSVLFKALGRIGNMQE